MSDKNLDMPERPNAGAWGQHLHWIDLMNREIDENTARYLARFKEDTSRDKGLLKEKLQGRQNPGLTRLPFWITEK